MTRISRFARMLNMLLAGDVSWHSFKLGLSLNQRSVCRKSGPGMLFCDRNDEAAFFQA